MIESETGGEAFSGGTVSSSGLFNAQIWDEALMTVGE